MIYFIFSPDLEIFIKRMASSGNNEENNSSEGNKEEEKPKSKNRLSLERSPYLLQHASNPVDW